MLLDDDLAAYLQAERIGTVGTTLFKGSVPQDAPLVSAQDALVALIEGPGMPSLSGRIRHVRAYRGTADRADCGPW